MSKQGSSNTCVKCGHDLRWLRGGICSYFPVPVMTQLNAPCGCKCEFPSNAEEQAELGNQDQDQDHSVKQEVEPSNSTVGVEKDSSVSDALPLCPIHQQIEDRGNLDLPYGNNCLACSLNERQELLDALAEHLQPGRPYDSVAFLRHVLDFYGTHQDEGRVVVSYPAGSGAMWCPLCEWVGTEYRTAGMSGPVCPQCDRKGVLQTFASKPDTKSAESGHHRDVSQGGQASKSESESLRDDAVQTLLCSTKDGKVNS